MAAYYRGEKTTHFTGSRFYNPWSPHVHSWKRVLKWKLTAKPKFWPDRVENHFSDLPPARVDGSELRVVFVGHSTILIQTQGLNILTDPVWAERLAPLSWLSGQRISEPGIEFEHLPKIDVVLISHNHYDHLHLKTLAAICRRDAAVVVTPLGNDAIIHAYDPRIVVRTLDWNDSLPLSKDVVVHLLPAQHWSGRGIFDINKALWGAFVLTTPGGNLYFAGDTGYEPTLFSQAKETFSAFRFAMLPIGSYEPRWFMNYVHMNPQEAVMAYKALGASYGMAMHYATFRLADEGYEDPLIALRKACKEQGVDEERFRTTHIGEAWQVPACN